LVEPAVIFTACVSSDEPGAAHMIELLKGFLEFAAEEAEDV
jgi:hypothetical protein